MADGAAQGARWGVAAPRQARHPERSGELASVDGTRSMQASAPTVDRGRHTQLARSIACGSGLFPTVTTPPQAAMKGHMGLY